MGKKLITKAVTVVYKEFASNMRIMNFIEKANKVLLFIAAIVVIFAIGKSLISDLFKSGYSAPKVQVIEHSAALDEEPKLQKNYIGQIKDVHILEITSDKIVNQKPYSANAKIIVSSALSLSRNAVNLMFTKAGEKNKVLFKNNVLIVGFSPVQLKETSYQSVLSKNIYSVVRNDTNKNGFLNSDDQKELLVSEYDGSGLKSIMDNIEGYQLISNNMILIYTKPESETLYYIFDVLSGELVKLDTRL
ncbi:MULTISPECIES: hypothetical protein [unclassified Pseudoalteromonas]|uniref:hypothetical protein n=1 Tax=unclassified Pseudoalteromonas TaxID=194690 RepID=UPI001FB352D6|nr:MULTISPECIES: hypothetical protein [unclassified Pseudoalteromonas]UOB73529.1 hypothetical protein MTP24_15730 [Pseudoalteromonas sp. APM04]